MPSFIESAIAQAQANPKTIVLPEGHDERILAAASDISKQGIAKLAVLGNPDEIAKSGHDLSNVRVIDPAADPLREAYAAKLYDLRKEKGLGEDEAAELVANPLYFGAMMVKMGDADGMVAGAANSTSDVLRPALQILKTAPGSKLVSSFFIMIVPDCEFGENGMLLFSDCGLEIQPSADRLAEIAISSAKSWESFTGKEARVALLSHSTYGSAPDTDDRLKVARALALAKEKSPDLLIDGELQLDAAIVESVGKSKAPGSPVAGKANVLVFPDLDAGNIGYKLVQRFAKAEAYGPIMQGLAAPVNDLSRGCSAEDVVGVVALTSLQAQ